MSHVLVCWSVLPLLPPCLLFTSHTTGFHHYHIKCPARTAQPVYYCFAHWLILVTEGYRSNLVKVDYYVYENLSDGFEFTRPWQLVFVVQHFRLLEWIVKNPSQSGKFDLYQYFGNMKLTALLIRLLKRSFSWMMLTKISYFYTWDYLVICVEYVFSVMLLHKSLLSKDW